MCTYIHMHIQKLQDQVMDIQAEEVMHTRTQTRTRARTHTHKPQTHTHTHTHTHTNPQRTGPSDGYGNRVET